MDRYVIGKDFNTKDWWVYDDIADEYIGYFNTEDEARWFAEMKVVENDCEFGLTKERYKQMMEYYDNDREEIKDVVIGWGIETCNKGYAIFDYDGLGLLELCKVDCVGAFDSDYEVIKQAEKDGIKIIPTDELPNNMPLDIEIHLWIDTEENRSNIDKYFME